MEKRFSAVPITSSPLNSHSAISARIRHVECHRSVALHRYHHRYKLPVSIGSHAKRKFQYTLPRNKSISPSMLAECVRCVCTATVQHKIIIIDFIIQAFFFLMFAACSFNFCLHVYRFTPANGTMEWLLWLRRIARMQPFDERNCCCTNISGLLSCSSCVVECTPKHMKRFQIIFDILRKRAQRRTKLRSDRIRMQAPNAATACLSVNVSSGHVQQKSTTTQAYAMRRRTHTITFSDACGACVGI